MSTHRSSTESEVSRAAEVGNPGLDVRHEVLVRPRATVVAARRRPDSAAPRGAGSLTEWTARPVGRLGRPLLLEIEAYLQFFGIAHGRDERRNP